MVVATYPEPPPQAKYQWYKDTRGAVAPAAAPGGTTAPAVDLERLARAEQSDRQPIAASDVPWLLPAQPFAAEYAYAPLPSDVGDSHPYVDEDDAPSVADLPRFGSPAGEAAARGVVG